MAATLLPRFAEPQNLIEDLTSKLRYAEYRRNKAVAQRQMTQEALWSRSVSLFISMLEDAGELTDGSNTIENIRRRRGQ